MTFKNAFFVVSLLVGLMCLPLMAHAKKVAEDYPAANPRVQSDMPLPDGFFFDEKGQQYKKIDRVVIETIGKDGKKHRRRVIRTTCYELAHENSSSRAFRPVQCRSL
jgi:hypothetical protein